jgi:outer membrane protein OmpA-like peptidoglycan-associated protein
MIFNQIKQYRQIFYKYILVCILMVSSAYSQAPTGEMQSVRIKPNGDTLVLHRKYGDLWYGVTGGLQLPNFFGELNVFSIPGEPNNPFNRLISYSTAAGGGYFLGALIEYNPKEEVWGYLLKVKFLDSRNFNTQTTPTIDSLKTSTEINASISQITVSPSVRYNIPIEGLHLFGGLNFEIARESTGKLIKRFVNGGQIYESNIYNFSELAFGYGANIGIGYDFMIADISQRRRALVTPFAELQFRSGIINDNSSSWNSIVAKFGFQIKIGSDEIVTDTLYFDPSYIPPAQYLAEAKPTERITFTVGVSSSEDFSSNSIEYIPLEKTSPDEIIGGELSTVNKKKSDTDELDSNKNISAEIPSKKSASEPVPNIKIERRVNVIPKKGALERFSYGRTESTELTQDLREYLKKVAAFMKANPNTKILIVGHSDMSPSLEKNTIRARQRAKNVEKYLLTLDIPQNRIIASWKGTLFAVAPNDTEEGRYKNRRVDITIE